MRVRVNFLRRYRLWLFLSTLGLIMAITAMAPLEKTLGARVRLVYLHGAWVWTGKVAFGLAGLAGLGTWLFAKRRLFWAGWSLALGRTGLIFWLTYLPLSLVVQQLNWGGIYWDEPRWRIPLAFGVAGVLLQAALTLFNRPQWTAMANLVFGVALWVGLGRLQNVLHPDSPIFGSGSQRIEAFFLALLFLTMLLMIQVALWLNSRARHV
ncbi:MAG TPA: hypothetical protein DEQ80_00160 [Anaerolinea thermolimosa]|uniref:Uncharacterized protein n=2 Tax=Anaerolinea thermolimosa TaxID=229919 RepID=A0A3D1JDC0_9CHLR|nr:hypothetical protein ATHL_02311 [Anaerolinea thermolimosa]HCE16247.1 hypothetical protein [Anaerolinea thermolimosa]